MKDTSVPSARLRRGQGGFAEGAGVVRGLLRALPSGPGIYQMRAADGALLYVGKARNLKKRVGSYAQAARLGERQRRMVAQIRAVETVETRTEAEALLLEANLIHAHQPPFNVLLRDDKSYPFLLLTRDHAFPQLLRHRGVQTRKGWYFGPFASASAAQETLATLQKVFLLRTCPDTVFAQRTRPCLQYHIKRCTAPCVQRVTEAAYAEQVEGALAFLRGRTDALQKRLAADMQAASDALDYEKAAQLRDRIKALTATQTRQDVVVPGLGDADVVGLHRAGGRVALEVLFFRGDRHFGGRPFFPAQEKDATEAEIRAAFLVQFYADKPPPPLILLDAAPEDSSLLETALGQRAGHAVRLQVPRQGARRRLVEQACRNAASALERRLAEAASQAKLLARVAELFGLAAPPRRIEVYDNSHLSGTQPVGAMIAAGPEGFLKKTYRLFNIRDAAPGDDFAMMREVFERRFQRLQKEDPERRSGLWPDLVLIDGGRGQLDKVVALLEELGVADMPLVGIAKGPDRNAGRERFFLPGKDPFGLPLDDATLHYLQRLRDEAHRFAIGAHRARRQKALGRSGLETVPGVGAARKKALLQHFGSARAVADAAPEDLARVPGISPALAKKIHDSFRAQR